MLKKNEQNMFLFKIIYNVKSCMRVMRLIIESLDLFILWMINHDKSFNPDAIKPCDGWKNGWYYLEWFMSSWGKMKSELLAMFWNCFTLIEVW